MEVIGLLNIEVATEEQYLQAMETVACIESVEYFPDSSDEFEFPLP